MSYFPSTTYMERYSTSFIRDILQIKTAVMYHLTPVWIAILKKSTNNKCLRECGEKGTLMHCWWQCKLPQCKLIQLLWRTVWRFLKKLKIELPATSPWAYTQRIARTWKQPKCPSTEEWIKMWYIYTVEYYVAIKREKIGSLVEPWMSYRVK